KHIIIRPIRSPIQKRRARTSVAHLMKTFLFVSFLVTASTGLSQSYLDLVKADPNNWFSYSGSFGAQRHSALKQIHTGNVDSLMVKWIYHVPRAEELEGVPVVSNGVMYVTQSN